MERRLSHVASVAVGIAIDMGAGAALGVSIDNASAGVAIGAAVGLG